MRQLSPMVPFPSHRLAAMFVATTMGILGAWLAAGWRRL